jgi:hypothetical protein
MRPAQVLLPDGISLEHLCVPRQVGRCYGRHACTGSCERNRPHAKGGGQGDPGTLLVMLEALVKDLAARLIDACIRETCLGGRRARRCSLRRHLCPSAPKPRPYRPGTAPGHGNVMAHAGVCAGVSVRASGRACQCLWASLSLASLWVEDVLECTGRSTNNTNI